MTFLPIVERELRIAARRKGTHWLRFLAALLVIVAVAILLVGSASSRSQARVGQTVFITVSIMAFGFCLVAGIFLTADCLCSERREGTLGLLFLTDLKGYDVVLGKLVANSVVSVYAVLAIIPMLGLPLLMGGVTFAEFARMTLVLFLTLLLSLSSGLLASAVCRDTRTAVAASFCVMLGLTGGLYLLAFAVSTPAMMRAPWILLPSPLAAFVNSNSAWYDLRTGYIQYWISVLLIAGMALVQLFVTSILLPHSWQHSWQDKEVVPKSPSEQTKGRLRRRVPLLANPFEWLVSRERLLGGPGMAVFIGLFAVWLCLSVAVWFESSRKAPPWFIAAFGVAFGLHLIVKGLLAMEACRRLSSDRRSGALELMLATSLSPQAIIVGQWRALKRQFAWPIAGLVMVNLAMAGMVMFGGHHLDMSSDVAVMFCLFFLGGVFLLWVDFHAIGWVGMWMGLRGLRHHHATLNALGHVMLPPWVAVFLFIMLAVNSGPSRGTVMLCWAIWIGLSVTSAQVAVARRKHDLLHQFRRLAAGDRRNNYVEAVSQWNPGWKSAPDTPVSRAR